MVKLEVTFSSGAQVIVDVESFHFVRNGLGERSLSWVSGEGAPGRRNIVSMRMDSIDAIVEVLPEDWSPDEHPA